MKEWSDSDAQILFDFGLATGLWWMLGQLSNGQVLFARYTQAQFIEAHGGVETQKGTNFDDLVKQLSTLVEEYERLIRFPSKVRVQLPPPLPGRVGRRRRRRR